MRDGGGRDELNYRLRNRSDTEAGKETWWVERRRGGDKEKRRINRQLVTTPAGAIKVYK